VALALPNTLKAVFKDLYITLNALNEAFLFLKTQLLSKPWIPAEAKHLSEAVNLSVLVTLEFLTHQFQESLLTLTVTTTACKILFLVSVFLAAGAVLVDDFNGGKNCPVGLVVLFVGVVFFVDAVFVDAVFVDAVFVGAVFVDAVFVDELAELVKQSETQLASVLPAVVNSVKAEVTAVFFVSTTLA